MDTKNTTKTYFDDVIASKKKRETAERYLRSITYKLDKIALQGEEESFRNRFTDGKLLKTYEIPGWEVGENHKEAEEELQVLAKKYGLETSDEKLSLRIRILTGGTISLRTVDVWKEKEYLRTGYTEMVKGYKPIIEAPELEGGKWINFWRDRQIYKLKKEGNSLRQIAKLFKGEDQYIKQVLYKFKKRLFK